MDDQENPQPSIEPVPSENRNPVKKKSRVSVVRISLALCLVGFVLWAVIAPQFVEYCCGAYDSAGESNLYNIFLACKAYWADSGSRGICNVDIAALTTYGYIQTASVKVDAYGNEESFSALATITQYEKENVFRMDSMGMIQEITDPKTIAELQKKWDRPEGRPRMKFK